jgi:hypothetical protein
VRQRNVSVTPDSKISPRGRDAIRIVPIAAPAQLFVHVGGVAPVAPPQLTYRGGPLLAQVEVYTLYLGSAWAAPALGKIANDINKFFDSVLASDLIGGLSEYSTGPYHIASGRFIGTTILSDVEPANSVTDEWIRSKLVELTNPGSALPSPSSNLLYFVYLPPGVSLVLGGSKSCQAFCGYHDQIDGKLFYAAMPYPNCNGCLGSLSTFQALTSTSSHELCEAITDPIPGEGWYDDANGEIGDICAWQTRQAGAYTVQLEWSNKNNRCK